MIRLRRPLLAATVAAATLAAGVGAAGPSAGAPAVPALSVQVVQSGLAHPWAMAFTPDGSMLYTQRDARTVTLLRPDGSSRVVLQRPEGMWNGGETGLMGIEVAADFATSGEFFTCHGYRAGSTQDVRVVAWRLDADRTTATFARNLVTGLPSTTGRHGGCALKHGGKTALYVGTGDAATGKNPQKLSSGGGKVLRISTVTGKGWPGNPYDWSANAMKRRVFTSGHRNVQGLARDADARIWSVEHGSYRDDEVNYLVSKGNYGWNPVPRRSGDPSYNEGSNSPMTDFAIPGAQRAAAWSSGNPTVATSGAAFLRGDRWGDLDGALAVAALKDQSLRIMSVSGSKVTGVAVPPELDARYGRLRGVAVGPDGALYVSTSNGSADKILRITPA